MLSCDTKKRTKYLVVKGTSTSKHVSGCDHPHRTYKNKTREIRTGGLSGIICFMIASILILPCIAKNDLVHGISLPDYTNGHYLLPGEGNGLPGMLAGQQSLSDFDLKGNEHEIDENEILKSTDYDQTPVVFPLDSTKVDKEYPNDGDEENMSPSTSLFSLSDAYGVPSFTLLTPRGLRASSMYLRSGKRAPNSMYLRSGRAANMMLRMGKRSLQSNTNEQEDTSDEQDLNIANMKEANKRASSMLLRAGKRGGSAMLLRAGRAGSGNMMLLRAGKRGGDMYLRAGKRSDGPNDMLLRAGKRQRSNMYLRAGRRSLEVDETHDAMKRGGNMYLRAGKRRYWDYFPADSKRAGNSMLLRAGKRAGNSFYLRSGKSGNGMYLRAGK